MIEKAWLRKNDALFYTAYLSLNGNPVSHVNPRVLASLIALLVVSNLQHAQAYFIPAQVKQVPVIRLLTNLENKEKNASKVSDRAMLEFQIGRLHSMAYALKTDQADVDRKPYGPPTPAQSKPAAEPDVPFYGNRILVTDYNQFEVKAATPDKTNAAHEELQKAITHLGQAVKLDPALVPAKLGLAWCLDQSGQPEKCLPLYREVFKSSWPKEKDKRGTMFRGTSVVVETGTYLQKILNPLKDAAELADIKKKCRYLESFGYAVTPLVIPLAPHLMADQLMQQKAVTFDLDGSGKRRYGAWPSNRAGWLVYDATGSKKITSGLQLFGQRTFWIFWDNGYEALQSLDDNQDGKLEGDELKGLVIWQDRNCNGISDAEEVQPLSAFGIQSLACTEYEEHNGMLSIERGVKFTSGETAQTYDWIVQESR